MRELSRRPSAIAIATTFKERPWVTFGARLVFWPLVLLTFVALALELGAWSQEFKIAGPFVPETSSAQHSLKLMVPNTWLIRRFGPLRADDSENIGRSDLKLWIDGREMGPPHGSHETIRKGATAGFSHWETHVLFSLPPGTRNARETIATIQYKVRPPSWVSLALAVSSGMLAWIFYHQTIGPLVYSHDSAISRLLRSPYWVMLGLCGIALIVSAVYVLASLYAFAAGWALPTTALIRWSPVVQWAARNEPYLGYLLLTCAGVGTMTTWLAGSISQQQHSGGSYERMLLRFLRWSGFPIAACAFVFCISAMWTGIVRPGDPNNMSIGGLVPFNDASDYLASTHHQAKDGVWNYSVALWRPLASAFRSVLLFFSNYSLQTMLILQACLLAAAAWFAADAVARWRGIWAGIAFFGLTYIYDRTFTPTVYTEPLALFWALLSVPFFIEAFRTGSVKPALVAFAMTAMALMMRMGSMFTIPALLVWLVWQFGRGMAAKLRIAVVSICILLGVLGLNSLLSKIYGTGQTSTGGNFSYVVCGLTIGTTWHGCPAKLAAEGRPLQGIEADRGKQLYSMAAENFRAHPDIFFGRLQSNLSEFFAQLPDMIWTGYFASTDGPSWVFRTLLTIFALLGLSYVVLRRATPIELSFWMLLWVSIVASASIVFADDGRRVLAVSHPLIALFFALGMSDPRPTSVEVHSRRRLVPFGLGGLLVAAVLLVGVPWIAHRFSPDSASVGDNLLAKPGEAVIAGDRRMSGFLVVENGSPLRSEVPMLHLAEFEAIIQQSGVENYRGLLRPVTPPLPFGFVFAPRLEKGSNTSYLYIVPAEVLERHDVAAWRFKLAPWGDRPMADDGYDFWFYVTKAEPLR
jgi:hypothetical protein